MTKDSKLTFNGDDLLGELFEDILVSVLPVLNGDRALRVLLEDIGEDSSSDEA